MKPNSYIVLTMHPDIILRASCVSIHRPAYQADVIMIPILPVKKWRHSEAKNECPIWSEGSQVVIFEECSFLSLLALVTLSYAEVSAMAKSIRSERESGGSRPHSSFS